MHLSPEEQDMLDGKYGRAVRRSMEILVALGTIYQAKRLIPVSSVQISGVSYDNLGDAGLTFLAEMAEGGGRARVLTTLNPAGMDVENWQSMGITEEFAYNQLRVLEAFARMDVITTCSCTPYLVGNLPHYGEHIAWAESSAVCYANSILGARSNREGGPSALAASLTGRVPEYGYHLVENRSPSITVQVEAQLSENRDFGALGIVVGRKCEIRGEKPIPYFRGIEEASTEQLKSFCASIATYGGLAIFHMENITPESTQFKAPEETLVVTQEDIDEAIRIVNQDTPEIADFISLGCPHLTIKEIARIAELLHGQKVTKEFWITTARPIKNIADNVGYTRIIEDAGAIFAADTCCVVAPIQDRFKTLATDSAKACYYARSKNRFATLLLTFDEVVQRAIG